MHDNWEKILNEGIASYAKSEPLAGLEDRVLARIPGAKTTPRRMSALPLVAACLGLAAVTLVARIRSHAQPAATETVLQMASISSKTVSDQPLPRPLVLEAQHGHRAKWTAARRKLPMFPSPTPLTSEERALSAMVQQDPEGAVAAFESLRQRSEPLEIEKLVVRPLETGGGQ